MLPPPDAALAHYSDRQSLVSAGAEVAAQMWAEVNPASIVESWTMQVPELTAVLSGAQLGAARQADPYLDEVAAWQEVDTATASLVDAKSFAGIASDGRGLMSLLMSPAFSALQVIASGLGSRQALSLGGQHLDTIARTQVADAGRLADGVSLAAHTGLDGYVRVVVGKTCSRCITLAGKKYKWNAGFQRHPHCDCVHLPCQLAEAGGLVQNPAKIYHSMTDRERTAAGWSKADQHALADGADIGQVTNAHRGVYTAGARKFTTQGTTKRGLAGSRLGKRTARLTPEQIYLEAGADRDAALRLLYDHGYLLNKPAMVSRRSLALAADAPAPMPVTAVASFDRRLSRAATENAAWEATPRVLGDKYSPLARRSGVDDWSESERRAAFEAVQGYKVNDYRGVNDRLRGRELRGMSAEEADRAIAAMDDAFGHSQLQQDVVVWRGVGTGRDVFGDAVDGDLTGVEWTDAAYMSTSALHDSAEHYARPRTRGGPPGVLFRIVVPPKVGAIGAEAVSDYRTLASASEAEVLLQRGLKLRVVRDRGLVAATDEAYAGPRSVRMLDVEVVPVPTKAAAVKKAAAMAGADLSKMTVTQLREVAKERGIKVPSRALKADIQALLRASKAPVVSDLSKLTIPKLRELAKVRGVVIPAKALKADIVKLLEEPKAPVKVAKKAAKKAAVVSGEEALAASRASIVTGENAREAGPLTWRLGTDPGWTAAETAARRSALLDYVGPGFARTNGHLRGLDDLSGTAASAADKRVAAIDEVMYASRLTERTETWRGIRDGRDVFGDRAEGDLAGMEWVEKSYVSTSARRASAEFFTMPKDFDRIDKGVLMRVVTPQGTGSVHLTTEHELLLERGLRLRVVKDHGVVGEEYRAYRLLDVEIVPVAAKTSAVKKVPAKKAAATKPEDLSNPQLRALAQKHGITIPGRLTKPEIIARIRMWEAGRPPILPGTAELRAANVAAKLAKETAASAAKAAADKAWLAAALRSPTSPRNPTVLAGRGGEKWWESIKDDTGLIPIRIRNLTLDDGSYPYTIASGSAYRIQGVSYFIEDGYASKLTAEELVRGLWEVHQTLPPDGIHHQRGYAWLAGQNPADAHWEQQYNRPGFTSGATAGRGGTHLWNRSSGSTDYMTPSTMAGTLRHEFGHNMSGAVAGQGMHDRGQPWAASGGVDEAHAAQATIVSLKKEIHSHPITLTPDPSKGYPRGVTDYGQSSPAEDFAESMRLYLAGELGVARLTPGGPETPFYFRDVWPARAAHLDKLLPKVAADQRKALARLGR